MLKAAGHKGHDRYIAGKDLPADVACCHRHENRQTDQPVAQNTANKSNLERQTHLGSGSSDNVGGDLVRQKQVGLQHQPGKEKRSDKIPQQNQQPVLSNLPPGDLLLQGGLDQQNIPGKEFRATDHAQHQSERKDTSPEQAADPGTQMRGDILRHQSGQLRTKSDIKSGQQTQNQRPWPGLRQHPTAIFDNDCRSLLRGQKSFILHRAFPLRSSCDSPESV